MITVGTMNRLTVVDELPFAYVLTDETSSDSVALTSIHAPKGCKIGMQLDVFVYYDHDGALVGKTSPAKLQRDKCALLTAVGVTDFAAFFDWGLERDLMVLKHDQERPIAEGLDYLVHLYHDDDTQRLLGSTRLHYFYPETLEDNSLSAKSPVKAMVYAKTDLGYKVMINDALLGLMFFSDAVKPLRTGDTFNGFVKQVRSDGKVDVSMTIDGIEQRKSLEQQILDDLQAHGGLSTLTDKSPPEEIYAHFNVSKGAYKKAIGTLFKQKKILLSKDSIKLI
ncbi:CvfB family protein [Alteromonas oceanisediminis]|uniref:CvfB family protein n=1 Tax=Alteromonas oceanisediminis TaxID=2836180 RepID=UPI001BDA8D62|nr:S1-like domain-containing RNA-binding protein [Alteromonas oceanisediminis]MBT0586411.1 hypothetical protein [Alteromonas oceanisediminis]